jgi:uncharacterized membrane protein YcaP (DUF421 family)
METVVRAVLMYVLLLLIFRIAGKRSLGEITTFDFLLLLIISETTQQAMVDNVLAAARMTQGLERMEQIKYAVLERAGGISIIPK